MKERAKRRDFIALEKFFIVNQGLLG